MSVDCYQLLKNGKVSVLYNALLMQLGDPGLALLYYIKSKTKDFKEYAEEFDIEYYDNGEPMAEYVLGQYQPEYGSMPRYSRVDKFDIDRLENKINNKNEEIKASIESKNITVRGLSSVLDEYGKNNYNARYLWFDEKSFKENQIKNIKSKGLKSEDQQKEINKIDDLLNNADQIANLGEIGHAIMATLIKMDNIGSINPSRKILKKLLDKEYEGDKEIQKFINDEALGKLSDEAVANFFRYASNIRGNILTESSGRLGGKFISEKNIYWSDGEQAIKGRSDLTFIRPDNSIDIFDFKFSEKAFSAWYKQKHFRTNHQLVGYAHMYKNMDIHVNGIYAIPIEFNLNKDNDDYKIEAINTTSVLADLSSQMEQGTQESTFNNVNDIIPAKSNTIFAKSSLANEDITGFLNKHFGYEMEKLDENEKIEPKQVKDFLNNSVKIKQNTAESKIYFRDHRNKTYSTTVDLNDPDLYSQAKHNSGFIKAVEDYLLNQKAERYTASNQFKKLIDKYAKAVDKGEEFQAISRFDENITTQLEFLIDRYVNEFQVVKGKKQRVWNIEATPEMQELGIALAVNSNSKKIHVINFTTKSNNTPVKLNFEGKTLLGNYLPGKDQTYEKGLDAKLGHVELLKTALFMISNRNAFKDYEVEHLISHNIFGNESPYAHLSFSRLKEELDKVIRISGDKSDFAEMVSSFKEDFKTKSPISTIIDYLKLIHNKKPAQRNFLKRLTYDINDKQELIRHLENRVFELTGKSSVERGKIELNLGTREEHLELVFITKVLLSLKYSVDLNDLTSDLSVWNNLLDENAKTSNPDEITQPAVRMVVQLVHRSVENIRRGFKNDVQNRYRPVFKKIIEENTGTLAKVWGDARVAYKNLFEYRQNKKGEWKKTWNLRNPISNAPIPPFQRSLTQTEIETIMFLKSEFNRIRTERNLTVDHTNEWNIPLTRASAFTKLMNKGIATAYNETIDNYLNPGNALDSDKAYEEQIHTLGRVADVYEYQENPDNRDSLLVEDDLAFEDNLEAVLYSYSMNHYKVKEFSKHMPVINAISATMLIGQHAFLREYKNVGNMLVEYVQGTIMNNPLLTEEERNLLRWARPVTKIAEVLAIGFSPTLLPVQLLTGLWGNLNAMFGVASDRFKKTDFMKAGAFVLSRSTADSWDKVNFLNYMTEEFGLFDSDLVRMGDSMKEDRTGIKAFPNRWMHWVSTYPDWVNRMHLFMSEALTDGVITMKNNTAIDTEKSALVFDKEKQKMVYDAKKDKRFSIYFDPNADKTSDEYLKQKSLYETILEEVNREDNAAYDVLPRPYTARQLLDKKKLANRIFGDYDQHNRTNFSRTALGMLLLQFKTWWLGVKNTWWKKYDDNGNAGKFVQIKTEDGQWKTVWQGRPMEGVLQSFLYLFKSVRENGLHPGKSWDELRDFQKQNIRHGVTSITMWAAITAIAQSIGDDDSTGTEKWLNNYIERILQSSGRDLFFPWTFLAFFSSDTPFMSFSFFDRFLFDTVSYIFDGDLAAAGKNMVRNTGLLKPFYDLSTALSDQ